MPKIDHLTIETPRSTTSTLSSDHPLLSPYNPTEKETGFGKKNKKEKRNLEHAKGFKISEETLLQISFIVCRLRKYRPL